MKYRAVLKENEIYWVGDDEFGISSGESGLYRRDTRFLSLYRWELDHKPLNTLMQHLAYPFELHQVSSNDDLGYLMKLGVERTLALHRHGARDLLKVQSYQPEPYTIRLLLDNDFSDMFQVRGSEPWDRNVDVQTTPQGLRFSYAGQDGISRHTEIHSVPPATWDGEALVWEAQGNTEIQIEIHPLLNNEIPQALVFSSLQSDYDQNWQPTITLQSEKDQEVLFRGVQDLRSLLFETRSGVIPAAGIPWFVAPFGRDSLIIGHMTVQDYPNIARGILQYLADHQGQKNDPITLEQPGKILHEERIGEFTNTGHTPHRPYYGTVDATPLFIWLCGEYLKATGDLAFVGALMPHIEAALHWMLHDADPDGDGFLEYIPDPNGGIKNQVWKDSGDSVFFEDGEEPDPTQPIAIVEVQGYAYAAYNAAAEIYQMLGQQAQSEVYRTLAKDLQHKFQQHFYWPEAGYYAHGLDGEKRQMRVLVSMQHTPSGRASSLKHMRQRWPTRCSLQGCGVDGASAPLRKAACGITRFLTTTAVCGPMTPLWLHWACGNTASKTKPTPSPEPCLMLRSMHQTAGFPNFLLDTRGTTLPLCLSLLHVTLRVGMR